jgi:MraZ protein
MFRGRFEHGMDDKGRVPFPSRFREVVAGRGENMLVLVAWLEECVRVYPLSDWEKVEEKLAQMPQFDRAAQQLRRRLSGEATEAELDKQGRILVPQWLRAHAHLEKEALFVGTGVFVELWQPAVWEKQREAGQNNRELLERAAAMVGL